MINDYLESVKKQFAYYKLLGERAMAQVPAAKLHWQYNGSSNSMADIVKHLSGNMLSRWTDFLMSDGEKSWRQRDKEFDADFTDREALLEAWERGWTCLFAALETVNEDNLNTIIYIRNQGHSVVEAINRQLAHYPYHIGQMIFIGKMILDEHWESLSIPRGASTQYNDDKFSEPKHREHFTDGFLQQPQ